MTDKKEIKEKDLEKASGGNNFHDVIIESPVAPEPPIHDAPPSPPPIIMPKLIYEVYCVHCGHVRAKYDSKDFPINYGPCSECSKSGIAVREVYE